MALPDNTPNMAQFQAAKAAPSPWLMPLFTILSSVVSAIVSVVVAFELLQSSQRLDHAAITRIESDVKEMRSNLPNTGAYDTHLREIDKAIATLESDLKAEDFLVQSIKTDAKIALRELERRR